MRDEMDARMWGAHGHQFSVDLHRLFRALHAISCKMVEINFGAPWRRTAKRC